MVIRPPSEADSYILQVTYGCSHNGFAFCGTYLDKPFQVRPIEEVLEDIALGSRKILTRGASFWRTGTPWCSACSNWSRSSMPWHLRFRGYGASESMPVPVISWASPTPILRRFTSENWKSCTWAWKAAATRFSAASTKQLLPPKWSRPCRS